MSILGGGFTSGPRMPGETPYQYRKRRSLELYGETPYERRIRLGRERGLSTQAARGHAAGESRRTIPEFPTYGPPIIFHNQWMIDNGYVPETTGLSWTQIDRIGGRMQWMAEHSSPRSRITPQMIAQARALEVDGTLERGWVFERLRQKYIDMYYWKVNRDNSSGYSSWQEAQDVREQVPELPIEWWTYH